MTRKATVLAGTVLVGLLSPPAVGLTLEPIGTYAAGIFDDGAAEIVAHDVANQQLFVTNASDKTVDVLDITDPTNPTKTGNLMVSGSPSQSSSS